MCCQHFSNYFDSFIKEEKFIKKLKCKAKNNQKDQREEYNLCKANKKIKTKHKSAQKQPPMAQNICTRDAHEKA